MTNPAARYAMALLSIYEAPQKCQCPRRQAISQMPKSTKSSHDNMNLGISSPNLSSQHSCITIISVNPKPDTIRAHLVSSTPKTNMELRIHVKNLLQIFILIALGIYCVELICELNGLFLPFVLTFFQDSLMFPRWLSTPAPGLLSERTSETLMPGTFS